MKQQNQKRTAFLTAALLLGITAAAAPSVTVFAQDTAAAAGEAADENVSATPVLIVEGNTIYVDAASDTPWNVLQGTISFDPSNEVADYGLVDEFSDAVNEQGLTGFPAQNVTDDGEFIFAAAYMSMSGAGVEYTGHIFYITFQDTSTPIDVTVYDEFNYELLTATVDGAAEAVTYTPDEAVVAENAAKHEEEAAAYKAEDSSDTDADTDTDTESSTEEATGAEEISSRGVVPIIVVLVIVALAAVTIVIAKKNKAAEQTPDAEPDVPVSDETSHKQ